VGRFVADLVSLMWPARPLAVIEASSGRAVAGAVAIAVNVGVFSVVGFLARMLAAHRKALVGLFVAVAACTTALELLWAGYDWRYVRFLALVTVLLLQAALFVAASRLDEGAEATARRAASSG
jgi:hypothetical protein